MSNSQSFNLLFNQFHLAHEKSLWVLDENPPINCPLANPNILVISNRVDVITQMQALGYNTTFSDFEFSALPQKYFQNVFYRISKEKMLAHHVINSAQSLLSEKGSLIISGAKQEGIKGYIERTSQLYQHQQTLKVDKQNWLAIFKQTSTNERLDDQDYTHLREVRFKNSVEQLRFHSKPGVFGWNKIDQGSKLLIEYLSKIYTSQNIPPPQHALDIGCGYGYLSLHCATLLNCEITATDNNAAAIKACEFNLNNYQVQNNVLATNCVEGINTKFDLIVCNPPFHSGFGVENDLTERFIKGAFNCLREKGLAIFVVNLHIPLERKAQKYFSSIEKVSDDKHFKVVILRKSQP